MRGAEWSLIIFTLLAQLAVGMFLVICAANIIFISKSDNFAAKEIADKILLSIIVALMFAIIASFFHIGKPKSAAYAVSHFSKSWLSREIAFLLLFAFLTGISLVIQHIWNGATVFCDLLTAITGIIGIIAIISMAKIYMLETVPAWNSYSTPIQFISTSLILGGITAILLFVLFGEGLHSEGLSGSVLNKLLWGLLCIIVVNSVTYLLHLYFLQNAGIAGAASYKLLTDTHAVFLMLRLGLTFVSIIMFLILLFADAKALTSYLLIVLCSLVFISEFIGRYLFYASYSRVGM
jgi:anaerobic dimethyl sulfoxide reductase subunit C (anchor subunit)